MRFYYSKHIPDQPSLWDTTEPALPYVLRRHHATRLHWDLRIRANGMLYSWCMGQPPSMNARRVVCMKLQPPHDPAYMLSERRIPRGHYGAGPTLPEDFGVGMPLRKGQGSQDQRFLDSFHAGRIEIFLQGAILKGRFRMEGAGLEWTITKVEDEFARQAEPFWPARSIFTGRHIYDL